MPGAKGAAVHHALRDIDSRSRYVRAVINIDEPATTSVPSGVGPNRTCCRLVNLVLFGYKNVSNADGVVFHNAG